VKTELRIWARVGQVQAVKLSRLCSATDFWAVFFHPVRWPLWATGWPMGCAADGPVIGQAGRAGIAWRNGSVLAARHSGYCSGYAFGRRFRLFQKKQRNTADKAQKERPQRLELPAVPMIRRGCISDKPLSSVNWSKKTLFNQRKCR